MISAIGDANSVEELYSISWSNPAWSHLLCSANVLDYFCDLSNPFYDRQCNNEVVRMQRLSPEQLLCMTGIEFYLDQAQESILFVIRKQRRLSCTEVTPLAYYYVINGTVLQAPDLAALLNSRLLTTVNNLTKTLKALAPCARYHPSDGSYSWDDADTLMGINGNVVESQSTSRTAVHSPPIRSPHLAQADRSSTASVFQVQRTSVLLTEWASRFPLPAPVIPHIPGITLSQTPSGATPFNPNIHTGSSATPAATALTTTSVATNISSSANDEKGINNDSNANNRIHNAVKDVPNVLPAQPRPVGAKLPIIPGVGLNAMSSLFGSSFPQSPTAERKRKLP
ncbi:Mediator of RNA polymerase II transcription [Fasciola gigantica]|uniref:Mediator of RNA polymerase II transcription subunit 6 n=1 Tax=Fasciola gigantica TaxID=46835 RepID=A0A504YZ58_FASGI|nr:Mediator of RNA polymerase II transcription [Fasciola gigantica]